MRRGARVALVTESTTTDLYDDGPLLLPALARAGIEVTPVSWGPPLDVESFDAAIIRTAWDYVDRRDEFLTWARSVAAVLPLANPADILEWTSDKRYLADLAAAGVPCIPTTWLAPGDAFERRPWDRFVVKPAVSAGSRWTASYTRDDVGLIAAEEHVRAIGRVGGVAMVQPHMASVDREGEVGTYVYGGRVAHAIRKGGVLETGVLARADMSLAQTQEVVAEPVTDRLAAFAADVLAAVPGGADRLVYARVDTVAGDDGEPMLLELELDSPYLFLHLAPDGAADAFARAVAAWLTDTAA